MTSANARLTNLLEQAAHPIAGRHDAYAPLLEMIGDARLVLIGEASHGTDEFYAMRAELTRRLVEEKGFAAVVAEADWPDAYRVNRYVRGTGEDDNANDALAGFRRFPQWMWRNTVVLEFVEWLRSANAVRPAGRPQCGFYGMDLYSLYASIEALLGFLAKVDPEAARRARYRYSCFEHFGEDPQAYGYAAGFDLERSCMEEAVRQLIDLRQRAADYARRAGDDEYFFAEQNAQVVRDAEEYYRRMFGDHVSTWNLRDRHMVETLEAVINYLDQHGGDGAAGRARVAVWAHNSHLGDARATEMGRAGEVNVGQLARERWGGDVVNIGFSTYRGTVTAADNWDEAAQRKRVVPGLPGTYEAAFHELGHDFVLPLRELGATGELAGELRRPRLERAIGVIYRPETERVSHYFSARLADQFDAMIHLDHTRAVEPLERTPAWEPIREYETYPTGV